MAEPWAATVSGRSTFPESGSTLINMAAIVAVAKMNLTEMREGFMSLFAYWINIAKIMKVNICWQCSYRPKCWDAKSKYGR